MEWHKTDAASLAIIDREIGDRLFSPSEYEIVRRVIYATGDWEYKSPIEFSERALVAGAAALAARSPIVVDVPMVQAGISLDIQKTFVNPIYCCLDVNNSSLAANASGTRSQLGLQVLAKRYPEAVFIIGQSLASLQTLVELIKSGSINPAFVIATPPCFLDAQAVKNDLKTSVPYVTIQGSKGSSSAAVAIMDALIDLAWQAFGER